MKKKVQRYQKEIRYEIQNMGEKAKSKLFGVIYSRTAVVMLLIILQFTFMGMVLKHLESYGNYMYGVFIIFSMGAIVYMINEKGSPEFKMTWLLFVALAPVAGVGFYFFNRLDIGGKQNKVRLRNLHMVAEEYLKQNEPIVDTMRSGKMAHANLSHYLYKQVGFPTYGNTSAKYFPLGDDKIPRLIHELNQAEKFIFMEYFIIEEGLVWDTVVRVLQKKVQQGVEVRVMYDGMCSVSHLPYDYHKTLQKLGIQCKQYAPIKPVLSTSHNNRDHRKICVIDGKIAFTGGVNLADEYVNQKMRFGHWKDTAIMLKGDAVESFTMMFLQMWNVSERIPEAFDKYLTNKRKGFRREYGYMIPYGDSPYDSEDVGKEVYYHILNHAKKYVHIMTPYLILDNSTVTTLCRAAKAGIEVQIIMPHIPDKKYAFYLAKTYYAELIESGVQIFEYMPGFIHAKVFVSDDDTATVGTVNLDYRSLYLHFECGVFIYHNPVVYDIEKDFQETLKKCHKVTLVEVHERTLFTKMYGQLLRLIAPLM